MSGLKMHDRRQLTVTYAFSRTAYAAASCKPTAHCDPVVQQETLRLHRKHCTALQQIGKLTV